MASSFLELIPDLYAAMDKVSREIVGFIPAVGTDLSNTTAAVNEDIIIPISRAKTSSAIVPAMAITEPTDLTVDNVKVTLTDQ